MADPHNNRIQKFNSSGSFITKWGSYGYGDGRFRYPNGVAVDSSGNVYVADSSNNRIQKFRPSTTITSTPLGAKIYIDGTDTGYITNRTFTNISAGTHTIKLTLSGYQDWYGTATVTAGLAANVSATLIQITAPTGSLTITSTPLGAKIYLNSTDTGFVTNRTFTNISAGTHTIKLTLSGYQDWYGTATVTAGLTANVSATLTQITQATGFLTITSTPPWAKIYIDDSDTGQVTDWTFTNISAGTHTIKLTLSGYPDWHKTTMIIANSNTNVIPATFVPFGQLLIFPNPFNPNKGEQVKFQGLPNNTSISIYNLAGDLAYEKSGITGDSTSWNGRNKDNEPVASGTYIYIITDANGNKKTGKVAVIW